MSPIHQHDCTRCKFIASITWPHDTGWDLYINCNSLSAPEYEFIIRYGEDGDYITVWPHHSKYDMCLSILEGGPDQCA
jgi:hypothetical protein